LATKYRVIELVEINREVVVWADSVDEAAAQVHQEESAQEVQEVCRTIIIEAILDSEDRVYRYNFMQKRYTQ